jgi:L,D-peptidoglycan transpeptidase YkuD (ErfK/YbiS/YcfS/YnhG family)
LSVPIVRRAVLALPAQFAAAKALGEGTATADENLDYRDGRLTWSQGSTRAAIGRTGVSRHKAEGDGATPAGVFPLVAAFYRDDRLSPPRNRLPLNPLTPSDAWVDDPSDANYNRLVALPYPSHVEAMWLDDRVYDLLVVIGYNMAPVVPGAGSAIFLHIARPDFTPTAGCIAIAAPILAALLPRLGPDSKIVIHT